MTDLKSMAEPAVANLLQLDDDQLYAELGTRVVVVTQDTQQGSTFELQDDRPALRNGVLESGINVVEIGKRLFDNLSADAYNIICGTADGHAQITFVESEGTTAIAAVC